MLFLYSGPLWLLVVITFTFVHLLNLKDSEKANSSRNLVGPSLLQLSTEIETVFSILSLSLTGGKHPHRVNPCRGTSEQVFGLKGWFGSFDVGLYDVLEKQRVAPTGKQRLSLSKRCSLNIFGALQSLYTGSKMYFSHVREGTSKIYIFIYIRLSVGYVLNMSVRQPLNISPKQLMCGGMWRWYGSGNVTPKERAI